MKLFAVIAFLFGVIHFANADDILFKEGWNKLFMSDMYSFSASDVTFNKTGLSYSWNEIMTNNNAINSVQEVGTYTWLRVNKDRCTVKDGYGGKYEVRLNGTDCFVVPRILPDNRGLAVFFLGLEKGEYLVLFDMGGKIVGKRALEPFSHIEYNQKGNYFVEMFVNLGYKEGQSSWNEPVPSDIGFHVFSCSAETISEIPSLLKTLNQLFDLQITVSDDYGNSRVASLEEALNVKDYQSTGDMYTTGNNAQLKTVNGYTVSACAKVTGPIMMIPASDMFGIGIEGYCVIFDKHGDFHDHWRFERYGLISHENLGKYEPSPYEYRYDDHSEVAKIRQSLAARLQPKKPNKDQPKDVPVIEMLKRKDN